MDFFCTREETSLISVETDLSFPDPKFLDFSALSSVCPVTKNGFRLMRFLIENNPLASRDFINYIATLTRTRDQLFKIRLLRALLCEISDVTCKGQMIDVLTVHTARFSNEMMGIGFTC